MPCEHNNFYTEAKVGKHVAGEGGPVVCYTAEIRLTCEDCKVAFHFGTGPRFSDEGREVQLRLSPVPYPVEGEFVPGQWRCPTCLFRLTSNKLHAKSGAVVADRDLKLERCPNGCGLLERLTWQESADEAHEAANELLARALRAESRISDLETAWPDNAAMPAELLNKYNPFE